MGEWLARLLQGVIDISHTVGVVTGPIALLLFVVAAALRSIRVGAAYWGLILLWPWHAYLWAIGIGLCFGAWGWWGLGALVLLSLFGARSNAAWLGIAAAFFGGQPLLASYLLAIAVGLFVLRLFGGWLIVRGSEKADESRPVRLEN